ncbi:MAG TPA: phosphoribosylglycinamide formyltransferase [Steroidobacteraceae bacterium]|jgi:phosphoribosylglycinamide formyltransferase-1|nr:phosphoribosylglycinamide formyltransferase [Steroidobacteraceae bacterium]
MSELAALPLAILISGRGSNMVAIAQACAAGRIDASVTQVISDQADAAGIARAHELALATSIIDRAAFADAIAFESGLLRALAAQPHELVALAGFMRILSPQFVARYAGRMLNIHPSLLPRHRGLNTHRRVLAARETQHGASVHFVTPELDAGPVVLQSRISVLPGDTERSLAARVQATEHVIYPKAIGWIAQRRLVWRANRVYFDGEPLDAPLVEEFRSTLDADAQHGARSGSLRE